MDKIIATEPIAFYLARPVFNTFCHFGDQKLLLFYHFFL